ncbi:YggT family protein [Candidatus Omnitrophota bacterium]
MYVLGNFLAAIAVILSYAITILTWLIIIRALISWVNPDPYNMIVQFLYRTTDPILAPFRKIIPMHNIGIDLSPIIAILCLWFVRLFIVRTLIDFAIRLQQG